MPCYGNDAIRTWAAGEEPTWRVIAPSHLACFFGTKTARVDVGQRIVLHVGIAIVRPGIGRIRNEGVWRNKHTPAGDVNPPVHVYHPDARIVETLVTGELVACDIPQSGFLYLYFFMPPQRGELFTQYRRTRLIGDDCSAPQMILR